MTSKELIQAHIGFLEQNMKHDSVLQPSLISDDMLEIEAYKKVLKDLEILDAIKNKAQNNIFFKGCLLRMFVDIEYDGKYFRTKKKIKDEDYEKIIRWLDNDK